MDGTADGCSITLERSITNWDTEAIEGRIHTLVASLNYKGRTVVTFPTAHMRVVINFRNTQTFASSVRSAFAEPRRYNVEVVWPYANMSPREEANERTGRRCLVRGEEGWWSDWKPVVKDSILAKWEGPVGLEDWVELALKPKRPEKTPSPWGADAW